MAETTFTRTFAFDKETTCKHRWHFTLSNGLDGPVIEEVDISPHAGPGGKSTGCQGHPKTIAALLSGLPVSSINIEALTQAGCSRDLACGQALGRCLQQIRAELGDG